MIGSGGGEKESVLPRQMGRFLPPQPVFFLTGLRGALKQRHFFFLRSASLASSKALGSNLSPDRFFTVFSAASAVLLGCNPGLVSLKSASPLDDVKIIGTNFPC